MLVQHADEVQSSTSHEEMIGLRKEALILSLGNSEMEKER